MTDGPPKRDSISLAALAEGPLESRDVEGLLKEFQKHTSDIMKERLEGLPEEVRVIVIEVLTESLRNMQVEEVLLAATWIEKRVTDAVRSSDRAELAGRAVKIRMHRTALKFAERYRMSGLNSNVAPGDQDRPTLRVTPPPVKR